MVTAAAQRLKGLTLDIKLYLSIPARNFKVLVNMNIILVSWELMGDLSFICLEL